MLESLGYPNAERRSLELAGFISRTHTFKIAYEDLKSIWLPMEARDPFYPGDPNKEDVCWWFMAKGQDFVVWNYKDGPRYGGKLEDIKEFSAWASGDDVIMELSKALISEGVSFEITKD